MTISFFESKDEIEAGDLVLAWMSRSNIRPITITPGEKLHTQYGSFTHDSMIGKPFGSQIPGQGGRGFLHALAPTPELWSLSLRHRTQIVYTPDASYIVQRLGIRPGSRVLEAGTGSASFTHAIARTIGLRGQLFTFEFHGPRYEEALLEIKEHGLDKNTIITHRDVCTDGFLNPTVENSYDVQAVKKYILSRADNSNKSNNESSSSTSSNENESEEKDTTKDLDITNGNLQANAVFLDLPSPWLAIPHLPTVLDSSKEASICCFSPCIEQVARAVETLRKEGWRKVEMVEVSSKRWEGHKDMVKNVGDAVERVRDIKRRRVVGIRKRNERIARDKAQQLEKLQNGENKDPQVKEEIMADYDDEDVDMDIGDEESDKISNKNGNNNSNNNNNNTKNRGFNPWGKGTRIREGADGYEWKDVSRVEYEIKSHTSYLTFAVRPPSIPEGLVNEDGVVISSLPKQSHSTVSVEDGKDTNSTPQEPVQEIVQPPSNESDQAPEISSTSEI